MKYYSEKTDKKYDSVGELEKDEKAYDDRKKAELTVRSDRAAMAKKVEDADKAYSSAVERYDADRAAAYDAYKKAIEAARAEYQKAIDAAEAPVKEAEKSRRQELEAFCDKYGAYHKTYTGEKADAVAKAIDREIGDFHRRLMDDFWLF